MLTLASLAPAELAARLAAGALLLRTGAFQVRLHSAIPAVAEGIGLLYGDYPLLPADGFADFHLRLERPRGLRRWFKPQVRLLFDGQSLFQALPLQQAFPMFEWGLNWCIANRAHRYLIIHAAVVERNGRAAILPAPPGSGKSTLCAALVHHGWRLLSDELTLLRLEDGHALPLPRPISLKNGSIPLLRAYLPGATLSAPVADTLKGTLAHLRAPSASVARGGESARPAWIVFPQYVAGAAPTLEALTPARAHMRMAENAFNYSLLGRAGFDALAAVIDMSRHYLFRYGALDDAVAAFATLAEAPP
ncbi:HprK-related kinase A [Janthinobacterium sp.]|uniref:HprK-related kinase A n=1 Tax=Janthinobacterium sp. TaxID=1871054 RepID=UPI00293D9E1B|nr:HprK-related kinase A [Janthinobacterium sp.]